MRYRCPTDPTPYDNPQPHDPPEGMSGCGEEFESEPDEEGLIDCPHCGLFFKPRPQDVLAKPYTSSAEIIVYGLGDEDVEKRIEAALRTVDGFDSVMFDWTTSSADEGQ